MSWIADFEGTTLINLDHAEQLLVVELEEVPQNLQIGDAFGVAVVLASSDDPQIIYIGTQGDCWDKLKAIASRLPMLKGVF